MRIFLLLYVVLLIPSVLNAKAESSTAAKVIDKTKLEKIEKFLSSMNTLEADMRMEIEFNDPSLGVESYEGKIWLDRPHKLLRIDYGNNSMIAKNGVLTIKQADENYQEFATEDTPAGILLSPSVNFEKQGINVISLSEIKGTKIGDIWELSITYMSPAGLIPLVLYFRLSPFMIMLGWTIKNPNGSITHVHLDPEKTHMAIKIDPFIFKLSK